MNSYFTTSLLLIDYVKPGIEEVLFSSKLRNEKEEFHIKNAVINKACLVSMTDLSGRIIYTNDKFCEISQYSKEELIGAKRNIVRHPDMSSEFFEEMWEAIGRGKIFHGIIKNKRKDGTPALPAKQQVI